MSQAKGIIPLFKQFRLGEISAETLNTEMDKVIHFCERKLDNVAKTKIIAKDQELWDSVLQPAIELSFKGLIAAAQLAQEYTKNKAQEIAEAFVYTFTKIDQATQLIEKELGVASAETVAAVQDSLSGLAGDQVELGEAPQQGKASTEVNLFD